MNKFLKKLIWKKISTANKYYYSVGHQEQKNKNTNAQIKFLWGHNKTINKISLTTFSM